MDSLKIQIGTLAYGKVENFIQKSITSTLIAFAKSKGIEVSKDDAESFLKENPPVPEKSAPKRTESAMAWQGFCRKYRDENGKTTTKVIGEKWRACNKGKDLSDDEYKALVELASKPKADKARPKSTGNAWIGFRAEFAAKNEKKPEGERLDKCDVTSAASAEWKKTKDTLSDEDIAKYQKIAAKNKKRKEKDAEKKKAAAEKRKAKKAAKKEEDEKKKKAKSDAAEKDSDADTDSGSESDDEPLTGNDSD